MKRKILKTIVKKGKLISIGNEYFIIGDIFMIYILFIIILLLLMISYIFFDRDLFSPPVTVVLTFCVSVGLNAVYASVWNLPMHFNTFMIILCEIGLFLLGGGIVHYFFYKLKPTFAGARKKVFDSLYDIDNKKFILINVIVLTFLMMNYLELLRLMDQLSASGTTATFRTLAYKLAFGEINYSRWYYYRYIFIKVCAYIGIYMCVYNSIVGGWNCKNLKFLVPVVLFLVTIGITITRMEFIKLSLYTLVLYTIICQQYNKREERKDKNVKLIKMICLCLGLFICVFFITGIMSGKIHSNMSFMRVLAHYFGINISAFDVFVNTVYIDTKYIGMMTLSGIYSKLAFFGFPSFSAYIGHFTYFSGIETNVYTAFRRYIQDYGYLGCSIIMFCLGFWYTFMYNYLKYYKFNVLGIIFYAILAYPVFLLCREEHFFIDFFKTTNIYIMLLIFIFYKVLLHK